MIFIVHTMPRRWVYLKMRLPDAYRFPEKKSDRNAKPLQTVIGRGFESVGFN